MPPTKSSMDPSTAPSGLVLHVADIERVLVILHARCARASSTILTTSVVPLELQVVNDESVAELAFELARCWNFHCLILERNRGLDGWSASLVTGSNAVFSIGSDDPQLCFAHIAVMIFHLHSQLVKTVLDKRALDSAWIIVMSHYAEMGGFVPEGTSSRWITGDDTTDICLSELSSMDFDTRSFACIVTVFTFAEGVELLSALVKVEREAIKSNLKTSRRNCIFRMVVNVLMPTKFLAILLTARKETALANWQREWLSKQTPPVEEVGEEPRCKMDCIVASGRFGVIRKPVAISWCMDGNGKMNVSTSEATHRIIRKTARIRFGEMWVLEDNVIMRAKLKASDVIFDSTLKDEASHNFDFTRQFHNNLLETCLRLVVVFRQVALEIILSPSLVPNLMTVVRYCKNVFATFN
ncbi:hypothetical protein HG531_007421 [Fusarium graminearum]|nr:hypothetical protein HG531_007421 [Fusarium graminearum]